MLRRMLSRCVPLLATLVLLPACGSSDDETSAKPSPVNCDPAADAKAPQRAACEFGKGALPKETLGCAMQGKRLPFEHVVLFMQENRSFDHYFQKLPEYGQPDVAVAPAGASNPAPDGSSVPFIHKQEYCFDDTNHEWDGSHESWNDGKNDGFAKANAKASDPTGARAMGYYDATDLPFYHQLADTFAISDSYFCSVMGPTWPNRMYYFAASSFGRTMNVPIGEEVDTLFDTLNAKGITWKEYRTNLATSAMFVNDLIQNTDKMVDHSQFAEDVKNGTLPQVSWVDPLFSDGGALESSEHPPGVMQVGQKWMYDQLKVLMESSYWEKTAIFITYDEHGGLYDHVPPPKACAPDDIPPVEGADLGGFDQLGFRVPVFSVSAYTKAHHVSHEVNDHTSIVRFVETLFDLPALTKRDANASAMLDFFDFENPPFLTPPKLDEPPIDQVKLEACKLKYPP